MSAYYSYGYTHELPSSNLIIDEFLERRKKIQNENIDDFVLREVKTWILPVFEKYQHLHKNSLNPLFLKYDEYINDTQSFIRKIFQFVNLDNEKLILELAHNVNPVQAKELVNSHQRSGKSRQWENKLNSNTQNKLFKDLKCHLEYWDFQ